MGGNLCSKQVRLGLTAFKFRQTGKVLQIIANCTLWLQLVCNIRFAKRDSTQLVANQLYSGYSFIKLLLLSASFTLQLHWCPAAATSLFMWEFLKFFFKSLRWTNRTLNARSQCKIKWDFLCTQTVTGL